MKPDALWAGGFEAFPQETLVSLLHRTRKRGLKTAVEVN
jgi:hypothetical protein